MYGKNNTMKYGKKKELKFLDFLVNRHYKV